MKAEDLSRRPCRPEERQDMIDELCRIMIGKENRMLALAGRHLRLRTFSTLNHGSSGLALWAEKQ